jgi:hypothetical protein
MWNVAQWFGDPLDATVTLDEDRATDALRAAARPPSRTRPPPPCRSPDPASPSRRRRRHGDRRGPGRGRPARRARCGQTDISITPEPFAVPAAADTTKAQRPPTGQRLLQNIGFYVGEERTVPIDAATAASWLTVSANAPGLHDLGRPAKIQASVDALPALVNRAPVNGAVVTDPRAPCSRRRPGRTDARSATPRRSRRTSPRSSATATASRLPVQVTPAVMATSARMLEVNLSEQMLY